MAVLAGVAGEIARQKERLFLWVPVAFGLGIALYFGLEAEPGVWTAVWPLGILVPGALYLYRRHHDSLSWFFGYIAAMAGLFATLGFGAAQLGTSWHGTVILAKSIGPVAVQGTVESVEKLGGREGSRVVLSHLTIEELPQSRTPKKIRLKFKKDEGIKAGQVIETLAKIDAPSFPVMPGAYDFRRHLFFQGIGGVGFSYKAASVLEETTQGGAGLFFERLRATIDGKIAAQAGVVSAGIMEALITGQRGAIADEDDDAMRDSGLYHLLSISGTHVAMVAGVLFFFVRLGLACFPWVALHWPVKKIAAMAALCGAAFYVILAGADVPAQRSLLMTGLVMVAVMLDRSPFSLRLIAFSALVVLAIAPFALIGVSFQMSYAAVAALICFFDYIRPWWMKWQARAGLVRKSVMYLAGIMLTSLIAGTVTGLFSLYHFQTFAVYGVISNMIAVPLTGFVIMPAAIFALLLMPFGLEHFALQVMEWGCVWMLAVAHWTAGLDGAVFHVRQWSMATYACLVVGTLIFLLWEGWRGKALALSMVVIGLAITPLNAPPDILVSGSGKLFALRDGETLYFSSGRKDKFAAENWQRLIGHDGEKPKTFADEGAPANCDDQGCRWETQGRKVSIVRTRRAFIEDCGWADLLLADIPLLAQDCRSGKMLSLFDFMNDGAHAIYIGRNGFDIRNVREEIGDRPWAGAAATY